ncbi:FliH/SctL family protein [Aminipila terrae]|uniref:Flagellar assembly protein FliH/Type III secretion system HrpE domain-containing protein n=1 Tax=Aminipila terrae TaxID=2697030 RepID=A0A6P1MK17_9FIRM|nr:FliH/SctL family protein [Aminipila terrae]QHI71976.1 hypothetical protein Ami3637_05830 [Aminipila terrae]
MRKSYEVLQVQTALQKAEKQLEEAIERVKMESNYKNSENSDAQKAVEDAMSEFKKAVMEEQRHEELKTDKGVKQIYGYGPELSRHETIDSDISQIDEDKKSILASILGEEILEKEELRRDEDLLNDEFHDGYDSLSKIASFNTAIKLKSGKSPDADILNESEEYEMKCFNEKNVFEDESYEYEADDIMPTNYYLSSFDDEEGEIKPYDINEALVLGEIVPPDRMPEAVEDTSDDEDGFIPSDEELEANKKEILEQVQKQAEDILDRASDEAARIIDGAHEEAQKIIEEKVQKAMAEASEKGFAQGFEKGQNAGYLDAENAVNEGMIQEAAAFRKELEESLQAFEERKEEILQSNLGELSDLAVNIAEKVIKISLKSSKDVVAKMIVAAAEDCRDKQWAKVYISHEEKAIAMNLEKELIDALNQISSNVKVVVMEDEPSGTCIIESPDQIIDASVGTQLDNIRQIISDNKS